jgi:hypothetical protein
MRNWSRPLAEAEQERRRQQRQITPLRVTTLHTTGGQELCVVRNISGGGLQARVYRRLDPGAAVSIELGAEHPVPARVLWFRDWQIGAEFLQPVDVDEALSACPRNDNGRNVRLPRLEVRCPARLQIGARAYAVRLCDISEGGAKVEMRTAIKKLSSVTLSLPDLPPAAGYVRWVEGLRVGIGFEEPLPHEVLARWVESRHGVAHPNSEGGAVQAVALNSATSTRA